MPTNVSYRFIETSFKEAKIDISHCQYHDSKKTPVTIALVSEENGSRTLLPGARYAAY